jgi:lipopolysaccharide export system protein LptA
VRVLQAPEKAGEDGVDIRGETLHLTHRTEGDVLEVMGTGQIPAEVQMDQLFILGPEITMDQTRNEVEVKGMGLMRMLSKQGFDGTALTKPSPMRVEWKGRMFFEGTQATFYRDVRAAQDTGLMGCEELQVTLDRHVSLKEGARGEQPAVEKLVCHNHVGLKDVKMEGTKIVDLKHISAPDLAVDNDKDSKERVVSASGPGMVRLFQLASKQDALDSPKKQPSAKGAQAPAKKDAQADDKEFKLTVIWYDGKMYANNVSGIARFYDNVWVVQVPTENSDLKLGNGVPPPGSMTLKCGRLEVMEHKNLDGTTSQEMRAYEKVYVEGDNFSASCDIMKYDSSKEQIIFEATIPGTYARLNQQKVKGAEPRSVEAKKITYSRLTGDYQAAGARILQGQP